MALKFQIVPAQPRDCLQIGEIKVQTWKSTYKGLISDKTLQNLSVPQISGRWKKKILSSLQENSRNKVLVAKTNPDHIIGYIHGGTKYNAGIEKAGEIYAFYVLQEYQNQGVGTQLFLEMKEYLRSLGYKTFFLWVLKGNPAIHFYEKMGGAPQLSKLEKHRGSKIEEIGMVWE